MTETPLELTVLMPCLNESDTLATCVRKARETLAKLGIQGEVLVADNGSTDGSQKIAAKAGARVVAVEAKGYGNALMGGIAEAKGKFILMGDADDSYDFQEIGKYIDKLRAGNELVQGCRLPSGGGHILAGAMPFLHRWWGNPMFSFLARWWFQVPFHDIYCGMRAFSKDLYNRLDLRCTGMEFATEMIIKASLQGARMAEVPITLHRDGRQTHAPHLKTFRDGWRTLRWFLLCTPRWLFLTPGLGLILLGLLGYAVALPGVTIAGATLDAHTLLFASMFILCGYQSILFALFAKTFAVTEGLLPPDKRLNRFFELVNLEKGLLASGLAMAAGIVLLAIAVQEWRLAHFGRLDYAKTMRVVIPGVTLVALGFQTVLSSFFVSLLGMRRK
jgi:glycosyltransferase involved in cell wall biosynthesis